MEHNRKYETRKALELLLKGKPGDVITREQMTEYIGRECWTDPGYSYVLSAINAAITQGVYWSRERFDKVYKCGEAADIIKAQTSLNKQSNRRAKKSLNVSMCVDVTKMTPDQASQHNLHTLVAGLVVTATGAPVRKRLEGKKATQPSVDDMLKLLTGESS